MAVELFVEIGGRVLGPLTADQVRGLARTGKLKPDDRIRKGGEGAWSSAGKVPALFDTQPARPGSAVVPRETQRPAELVPVRTTPAQIVGAVYGGQPQEVRSAAPPPPPPRPSRTDVLAAAVEQPMAPPLTAAPPVQPATVFQQQAPAYYPPQPSPQAQAYYPPQSSPQSQAYPGYAYPQPSPSAVIMFPRRLLY